MGHVAAPRGPTRRLRGDVTLIYIYIYMGVILHIVFRLSEENYYPSKPLHNINTIASLNFFHLRLSPTQFLNAGDMATRGALDRAERGTSRVDHVHARTTGSH